MKQYTGNRALTLCQRTLVPALLLQMLYAATAQAQDSSFVDVSIAPRAEERTVWRYGNTNLNIKPGTSLTSLQDNHLYAMVMYSADTTLQEKLRNDARVVHFQDADPTTQRGFAMVRVANLGELREYAELAHEGLGCGNVQLVDLNETVESYINVTEPVFATTNNIAAVQAATNSTSKKNWDSVVQSLVALGTRHHESSTRDQVVNTVKTAWENAASGKIAGFTIETVSHSASLTSQKSVVAKIPGTTETTTTVIIGSHLDSITTSNAPAETEAPGADDNATGVATIAEIIRTVGELGWKFNRTVEFHAYAAEEDGLVGSGAIAASYKNSGRAVASMMQIDMNGYSDSDKIWIVKEDSSTNLKRGLINLVNTYLGGNVEEASLTAGTSDHKSWTNRGFQAAFPFENPANGKFNPYIHSSNDTIDKFNRPNLPLRFIQLGVAYLAHYAGYSVDGSTDGGNTGGGSTPENPGTLSTDIKVAMVKATTADSFYLTAATGVKYATIEACRVSSNNPDVCGSEILPLYLAKSKNGRYFFSDDFNTTVIKVGERWRFAGYDNSSRLVARRDVVITAK